MCGEQDNPIHPIKKKKKEERERELIQLTFIPSSPFVCVDTICSEFDQFFLFYHLVPDNSPDATPLIIIKFS